MRFLQYLSLFLVLLLSANTAFASDNTKDEELRALLKTIALEAILPMVETLDSSGKKLETSSQTFCKAPNDKGFQQVREDWSETLKAWQSMDALLFGPTVDDQIDFSINFMPAKKRMIKGVLKSGKPIDEKALETAGVGAQGLASLEYLLFDREQSQADLLKRFSAESKLPYCEYLVSATALLQKNLHTIYRGWHPKHVNFAEAFYTAGKNSAYYTETQQPLEDFINKLYQSAQKISSRKLGVPLAKGDKEKVKPHKLEAWRSGHSLANIRANVQGIKQLLEAGGILVWLKNHQQAELAAQLQAQLKAIEGITLPSEDLFAELEKNPEVANKLYAATTELTRLIKTGLAPAMGIQLGFNDNDGD